LSNPVFNSLDFVHLRDDLLVFEKKIKIIGNHLGITILALFLICIGILNERNVSLFQDEFNELSTYGSQYFTRFAQSNLHLWDLIEKEGFCLLPQIARAAQSLSTTSSDVEQAFSIAKLIKTEKRSRMKEQTLESILIIWSFFRDKADIKSTQLQTGKLNEGQNQVATLTEFN